MTRRWRMCQKSGDYFSFSTFLRTTKLSEYNLSVFAKMAPFVSFFIVIFNVVCMRISKSKIVNLLCFVLLSTHYSRIILFLFGTRCVMESENVSSHVSRSDTPMKVVFSEVDRTRCLVFYQK